MRLNLQVQGRPDLSVDGDWTEPAEAVADFVASLDRDGLFDIDEDMRVVVQGDHVGWYRPSVSWTPTVTVGEVSVVESYSVDLYAVGYDKRVPLGTFFVRSSFGHGHSAVLAVEQSTVDEEEHAVEAVVTRLHGGPVGKLRTFGLTRFRRERPVWKATSADQKPVLDAIVEIEIEASAAERRVAQDYLDNATVAAWEAILRERKR